MRQRAASPILLVLLVVAALPLPTSASEPSPVREITMDESVEAALRHNTDVAVANVGRESAAQAVPLENAAFLPRFTGEVAATQDVSPSTSTLTGALSVDQRVYRFDLSATKLFRTGATLTLGFESQRQELNSAIARLTPEYTTGLSLSASQPLLKNRGRDAAEAPLLVARAGAAASEEEWKTKVMDVVAAARTAFLNFVAASRAVEVRRTALGLVERLLEETRARIGAGLSPPVDGFPAEAAVANRRDELIRAEATARNAADDLRTVMGLTGAEWEVELSPVPPAEEVAPPGEEESFEEAMRRRPEIRAQRARTEQADVGERAARNRALPALDLSLSGGLSGLAGTPNPDPLFAGAGPAFQGNYWDSLDDMVSGRYYNWLVGLRTEIPWRLDRERAEHARARLAAEEQRLAASGLTERIRAEVRKARRDLDAALTRVEASRAAAAAAAKTLEAEERKLSLGRSTVIDVLRVQQDFAEADLNRIRAVLDAHLARTRLWRAAGTILDREGIALR